MDQLSSGTAGQAYPQEAVDARFPGLQQEEHGQLLLLTNERTGSGELETIQNEIDRIVEAFDEQSIIQESLPAADDCDASSSMRASAPLLPTLL